MSKINIRWGWFLGIAICGSSIWSTNCAFADIIPDGTLPKNSSVKLEGNNSIIEGGTQAGGNLFHSFREFSVLSNGAALFNNAADIQNIISRVTGGSTSTIDGIIRANGTANLFLINPNGIIFGQNASLNIGGSFVATTANALQFGNRGFFSATEKNIPSPLLTVNPSALLFNQINQNAAIQNNSVAPAGRDPAGFNAFGLRVPNGKSLLLVGGNVSMDGGELNANGGRVELGGLAQAGSVALGVNGNDLSLRFPENFVRTSVSLNNRSGIYVEGAGGGNIAVNARNLEILGGSLLSAGIGQGLGTVDSVAGDTTLFATGTIKVESSHIRNNVNHLATGNGGNISITTGTLEVTNGGRLETGTGGQGNAGNLTINARDSVSFGGFSKEFGWISGAYSTVEPDGIGKGGEIDITADSLSLSDNSRLDATTRGKGDAGSVILNTNTASLDNAAIFANTEEGSVGNSGSINITTGLLALNNGARVNNGIRGEGNGGNVNITASDKVSLDGVSQQGLTIEEGTFVGFPSTVLSNVGTKGKGNGGNISITTGTLEVTNGGRLETGTGGQGNAGNLTINARDSVSFGGFSKEFGWISGAYSTVEPDGIGKGGEIDITADSLSLSDNSRLDATTRGKGDAGSVILNTNTASLDNAAIFANTEEGSVGNSGSINITTGLLALNNGARVNNGIRGEGNGGNVNITASDKVSLDGVSQQGLTIEEGTFVGFPSTVLSNVGTKGKGNGGNISITTGTLEVTNGGRLETGTGGQGNAGNLTINTRDSVSFGGFSKEFGWISGAYSTVEPDGIGKGGEIDITADSLSLSDNSRLDASTRGKGDAGNVTVQAQDAVSLANANIFSRVSARGVGKGGDININAATLSLNDGAQLDASTDGKGDAGNVTVQAQDAVSLANANIFSTVSAGGVGKGGDININAATLSLSDGAQLDATTDGKGDGGSVTIDARKSVYFDGVRDGIFPSAAFGAVGGGGKGNGGGIYITTDELSLTNGAQLQASTGGIGDSGDVIINARKSVSFDGVTIGKFYTFNSYAATRVYDDAQGKGGNVYINTGEFSLTNGAQVFADTSGKGDAGNILINAKNFVSVSGTSPISGSSSALFTFTNSTDKGGNIIVDTSAFRALDGGVLNAQTFNNGDGGSVTVRAKLVEVLNGGQLLATSSGNGRAGKITVNATDQVIVNGSDATYVDRVAKFGIKVANDFGTKGVNNINADSGLFVRSESLGNAGNIEVISPQIRLDNSGRFIAESASGNGGDINLQTDLLLLRRGAQISTTAGTEKAGGNGGDINIDAPSGFIVAVPSENSDITANAYTGSGGRVNIQAIGIYGIQPRSNPTSLSDITASSEFGVNGTVELNTPDIDPNSGLVNLPTVPVDTQVAQTCQAGGNLAKSSFTITGRGGLPPNPGEALNTDAVKVDLVSLNPNSDNPDRSFVPSKITTPAPEPIIEATGLALNEKGEVVLTANLPTNTPHTPWLKPASCRAS